MTDIVERLRSTTEQMACTASVDMTLWDKHSNACLEAAATIERLREALQSTSTMIELMCKVFDLSPEDFVINVNASKENGETRVVRSISAQEVLNKARAALGEKE